MLEAGLESLEEVANKRRVVVRYDEGDRLERESGMSKWWVGVVRSSVERQERSTRACRSIVVARTERRYGCHSSTAQLEVC